MSNLSLNFAIDTSGQPCDSIYVGLISIKTECINKFEKEFKKEFPKFYRHKEKGAKRTPPELKNIIQFMNKKDYIKMFTISFNQKYWQDYIKRYKDTSFLKEKIYSFLYSYLFTRTCFKHKTYNAVICEETYLDINKVIDYCNFLNKYNQINIILSKGIAKSTFLIRLADFIAASHRKVSIQELKRCNNYNIYSLEQISYILIDKILKK